MNYAKLLLSAILALASFLFPPTRADAMEVTIENWSKVPMESMSPPVDLPPEKLCDWFVEKLNANEKRISCGRITLASSMAVSVDDYSKRTLYQPVQDPEDCDRALPDRVFATNDAMMKSMNDQASRAARRAELVELSEANSERLRSDLFSRECPNARRAASILWKYSAHCRQRMDEVMPLINDDDPVVRNEISQCVGANIGYQSVERKKSALDAAVLQFQIPSPVDRLKAAWIVEQSLGDPAVRAYAQKYRPLFESALKIARVSNLSRSLRVIVEQLQLP